MKIQQNTDGTVSYVPKIYELKLNHPSVWATSPADTYPAFTLRGTDLKSLRQEAMDKIESLIEAGRTVLEPLISTTEILPDLLVNRAHSGGKQRRLLGDEKYTGLEQLSTETGRWELADEIEIVGKYEKPNFKGLESWRKNEKK